MISSGSSPRTHKSRVVIPVRSSPARYRWFGRRFVIMPDHIHLIAQMGHTAARLGQWMKAMKAVLGGLEHREHLAAGSLDNHKFTRAARNWQWQRGFHDHKLRTPGSETRKWEYICLNPVRYGLVSRPEEWPFSAAIVHHEAGGPRLIRGTPNLLEKGLLVQKEGSPGEGTRPTT